MTFYSALVLGLLASLHCAGMCGGLQSVLQPQGVVRSHREASAHLLVLNLGRLSTYLVAGCAFSMLGLSVAAALDIPQLATIMRTVTAILLLTIGLQILRPRIKPFAWSERLGAGLWRQISQRLLSSQKCRLQHSYVRGVAWGFLPCGLVYGVLMTTLFSDSVGNGVLVMLGFGMGTLPALVLTGGLYQSLRGLMQNRAVQLAGGLLFIQGGMLMMLAPRFIDTEFMNAYPQVMSSMFCIS